MSEWRNPLLGKTICRNTVRRRKVAYGWYGPGRDPFHRGPLCPDGFCRGCHSDPTFCPGREDRGDA